MANGVVVKHLRLVLLIALVLAAREAQAPTEIPHGLFFV